MANVQTSNPEQPAVSDDFVEEKPKFHPVPEELINTSFKPYKNGSKEAQIVQMMFENGLTLDELFDWYAEKEWITGQNKGNLNQYFSNIRKRLKGTGYDIRVEDGRRYIRPIQ